MCVSEPRHLPLGAMPTINSSFVAWRFFGHGRRFVGCGREMRDHPAGGTSSARSG
jgi:hypothetical protein